ncbi:hypothetical protein [Anaerospora hongkongensis]|uniref:hypothetical protein n=1 Tax=Anaerospora hongkongensis TaxID=244830 RepID=UPI00289F7A2C|nr:hypothetical protein [Anaerospora hongkongensis]
MQGKLLRKVKWGIGVWPVGSKVTIIQHSESHCDKVKIERFPGGPTAWVYLDDMEPID